jgi:hypothetical protein
MRVQLLESKRIDAALKDFPHDASGSWQIDRRIFLKGLALGTIALGSPLWLPATPLEAQVGELIEAALDSLVLAQKILDLFEPTAGEIVLMNPRALIKDGVVVFNVIHALSKVVEDAKGFFYSVPANHYHRYAFSDGPKGKSAGPKTFQGNTKINTQETDMEVRA